MMRVKVEIPFHRAQTDTDLDHGDIIEVSTEELARIRAVNVNMVSILGEVTEHEEKADDQKEEADDQEEEATDQAELEAKKKPATRKQKQ